MKAPALAEAVIDLPWLSPGAGSLVALVRLPAAAAWMAVRGDPGMVLLWTRFRSAPIAFPSLEVTTLHPSAILETALQNLAQPAFCDWNLPGLSQVYQVCLRQAKLAWALAENLEGIDPECAWTGGLLAPLGWLAAGAVDPESVQVCRQHPDFDRDPAAAQQQCWGLDHTSIARRLCRRWNLPAWLGALIGQMGLPGEIAQTLGADKKLFQVVQLAVGLVKQNGQGLGLLVGATPAELMADLGISSSTLENALALSLGEFQDGAVLGPFESPRKTPLLEEYLRLAQDQRNRSHPPMLEQLQTEVDRLHGALETHCAGEKERLRDMKLRSLAELAAGAGHEINNPLAVISGQAQYLLGRESDPGRAKSLQTIVMQTKRIYQILNELMQFARPSPPQKQFLEVGEIVRDVAEGLRVQAEQLQVQLICPELQHPIGQVCADPVQVRVILNALLRNALEAAPAEGWAGLRVHVVGETTVEFIVEDNGPGPALSVREHLFDPFFSGRSAGRGRGLGLPTAWRLGQLQGGQVRFEEQISGVTRFVFSLPLEECPKEKNGVEAKIPHGRLATGALPVPFANGVVAAMENE